MSFWDPKRLAEQAKQRRLDDEKRRKDQAVADKKRKQLAAAAAEVKRKKALELKKKNAAENSNYDFQTQEYTSQYCDAPPAQAKEQTKISRGFGSLDTKGIKKPTEDTEQGGKDAGNRDFAIDVQYPKLPRPF